MCFSLMLAFLGYNGSNADLGLKGKDTAVHLCADQLHMLNCTWFEVQRMEIITHPSVKLVLKKKERKKLQTFVWVLRSAKGGTYLKMGGVGESGREIKINFII